MKKNIARIIMSGFIAFSSLVILVVRVFIGFDMFTGKTTPMDMDYLKYFTSLSNFYNGFVFLYIFILSIIYVKDTSFRFSKQDRIISLSATSSVAITFLIAVSFLNFSLPNPAILYQNELLFFHIINPLLTIVIFIFFMPGEKITIKESMFGMIPLVLYSIFYTVFVLTGVWTDHYNFTFGGHYWVVAIAFPAVVGISFLLNWGLSLLTNKFSKN